MNRRDIVQMSLAAALAAYRPVVFADEPLPDSRLAADLAAQNAAIRQILIDRIDRDNQSKGIAAGIITPHGRRFIAHGDLGKATRQEVTERTCFEIGSVTKIFTTLLLTDAVQRHKVELNDPAARYLPSDLKALQRGDKAITLVDLATHTSGLPPLLNHLARDPTKAANSEMTMEEAYSADPADLYRFLSAYELTRDPGSQYEYSHLGMALLGHILAKQAGVDYATLLRTQIFRPLHMTDTGGPTMRFNSLPLAIGHDSELRVAPASKHLNGGGGLISSTQDLLRFVAVALGLERSPLKPAIDAMLTIRRPVTANFDQALGWQINTFGEQTIINKGGNTPGFCAFVAFDSSKRMGVVVLSNSNTEIQDIGLHLLRANYPLTRVRKSIPVDPARLDDYIGRYDLPPTWVVEVLRENDTLWVRLSGSPKLRLYRESDQTFFNKEMEIQFEFQAPNKGRATAFILHQKNGPDVLARRIDEPNEQPQKSP